MLLLVLMLFVRTAKLKTKNFVRGRAEPLCLDLHRMDRRGERERGQPQQIARSHSHSRAAAQWAKLRLFAPWATSGISQVDHEQYVDESLASPLLVVCPPESDPFHQPRLSTKSSSRTHRPPCSSTRKSLVVYVSGWEMFFSSSSVVGGNLLEVIACA